MQKVATDDKVAEVRCQINCFCTLYACNKMVFVQDVWQTNKQTKVTTCHALLDSLYLLKLKTNCLVYYLKLGICTCAAVEGQSGGGVKLLNEELRQRDLVIRA